MSELNEKLVERVARAICASTFSTGDWAGVSAPKADPDAEIPAGRLWDRESESWNSQPVALWTQYRKTAVTAIEASNLPTLLEAASTLIEDAELSGALPDSFGALKDAVEKAKA